MLREVKNKDTERLIDLINNVDTGYEIDDLDEIQKNAMKFIVFEEDKIKGFAYASVSIDDVQERLADMKIYVEPQSRRQGVGTALYHQLIKLIEKEKVDYLAAYIRVDKMNPESFCKKLGLDKWWGSSELYYRGPGFPDEGMTFVQYEDKYFDQYVKVVQECYYPINKSNDIKPYLATNESVKRYQLNNKKNVYLALDRDQIIASVTTGNGTVENLMVSPAYQGKGFGKKALQFSINKILSQGCEELRICYMEGNNHAENLYYSLGFKFLQNTHVYRRFFS
ncbi:GNAT family N-acetyltransferase [Virgibacillus halodenitrificans]|uniref:GNAT family N-acetyltransferase n=1 Tax=Virgibacillus halodenitrificans TaxID=1482 RepID=UPI00136FE46D|nr:GNAT family N-acetyltransferase [Virgibacillus halodenitrificans]